MLSNQPSLSFDSMDDLSEASIAYSSDSEDEEQELSEVFKEISLNLKNLDPSKIKFLRRVICPSKRAKRVVQALWGLINMTVEKSLTKSWRVVSKALSKDAIDHLLEMEPSKADPKLIKKICDEFLDDPAWDLNKIYHGSYAAGVLAEWLSAFCLMARAKKV